LYEKEDDRKEKGGGVQIPEGTKEEKMPARTEKDQTPPQKKPHPTKFLFFLVKKTEHEGGTGKIQDWKGGGQSQKIHVKH